MMFSERKGGGDHGSARGLRVQVGCLTWDKQAHKIKGGKCKSPFPA